MKPKSMQWLRVTMLVLLACAAVFGVTQRSAPVTEAQGGTQIVYGSTSLGTVAPGAPPIAYTFDGMAGDLIQVDIQSMSNGLIPSADLLGPDQLLLATGQHNRLALRGDDAHLAAFLPQTGTYTIAVSGKNGSAGDFVLRLHGRGAMPSTPLQYGVAVNVNIIENAQPQYFVFDAEDCPTTLIVTNLSTGEPYTFRYVVKVRNELGTEVALLRGGEAQEDRATVPALSGRYEIEVFADDPSLTGQISLLITCAEAAPGCEAGGEDTVPARDPSCPPCPSCPETFTGDDTPTCPDMNFTATVVDPAVRATTLTWNPVPGADHYLIHIYGLRDDDEHYLGAAGVPGTATDFVFDHLFPDFFGYRFVIEAIQGETPICIEETTVTFPDLVPVCPDLNLQGQITNNEERWAEWTWNPFPDGDGYFMQLEAMMPDGSVVLIGSATFGADQTAWDTNHPLDLAETDTFRLRMQVIMGETLVCPAEATITFQPPVQEPCEIVAERGDVRVHVGPGRNRSVFTYLSPGRAYSVTGQAVDSDGNIWWQIDKTQVPGHEAVLELWVAESDVTEHGNCTAVPQAEGPGLIPVEPEQPGTWGECGSCVTCGHPGECVLSPDGECLWDPATCGSQEPPPPADDDGTDGNDGNNGDDGNEEPPPQEPEPEPEQECVFVTASVDPGNTGTAGPLTAANCVSQGSGYLPGTVVQVGVSPNPGCWLDHWSGCGAGGTANPVSITVNATCHIVAHVQCMQ
jgi:hypothetical protein